MTNPICVGNFCRVYCSGILFRYPKVMLVSRHHQRVFDMLHFMLLSLIPMYDWRVKRAKKKKKVRRSNQSHVWWVIVCALEKETLSFYKSYIRYLWDKKCKTLKQIIGGVICVKTKVKRWFPKPIPLMLHVVSLKVDECNH